MWDRRVVQRRGIFQPVLTIFPWGLCLVLGFLLYSRSTPPQQTTRSVAPTPALAPKSPKVTAAVVAPQTEPTVVSYGYFQKDAEQMANFAFFLLTAVGLGSVFGRDTTCDFVIVINGGKCTPCQALDAKLSPEPHGGLAGVAWVKAGPGITLIMRSENEGMDFAAHNTTLSYLAQTAKLPAYKYFFFLNSSVKGPFVPSYHTAHWTRAYTSKMSDLVKVVSSSIVCLPEQDAGGYGPKVESWAFAADAEGVRVLVDAGVFWIRADKLGQQGVVVMGEYGITKALEARGLMFDTLMARYKGVDWRDPRNWRCNDNVHPSRHGTYDGMSMHPFEVVFVKSTWHVGHPFVDKYAEWEANRHHGVSNALGSFNRQMYLYAIQPWAQNRHPGIECAYAVVPNKRRNPKCQGQL